MQFHVRIGEPDEVQASSEEALRTFARASRREPADPDYDYILGEALLRAGRAGEAVDRCRDAVRLDRLNPDYQLALGRALFRLGRFEDAEPALREAAQLRSDAPALNAHGATLLQLNRLAEAEAVLQRAVRVDPGLADAYGNLAAALWELGQRHEAITVLRRGCRKAPSDREVRRNLGVALLGTGQAAAATKAFRAAAACGAGDAGALLDLAEALAQAGRGDEVPHWFRNQLFRDDIVTVARAPVENDTNVRDRLAHAVNERRLDAVLDPRRCIVHTQPAWRRISCAYSVPVELLAGLDAHLRVRRRRGAALRREPFDAALLARTIH